MSTDPHACAAGPRPLLSICIATRQRCAALAETLMALAAQMPSDGRVEVVVADGASGDGTAAMLARQAGQWPWLRWLVLAENGGVDRDYDRCVAAAAGEWCWLFTDDDLPHPQAIARICAALMPARDLVVIDAEVRDRDCRTVLRAAQLPWPADRELLGDDPALLPLLGQHLTFIGATIIRRAVWCERDRERYYGSLFIHVGVIFQRPLAGRVAVLAGPLVAIRYGIGGWTPRRALVWLRLWPELIWSFTAWPERARAQVTPRYPWRNPARLLPLRALGALDAGFVAQHLERRISWPAWAMAWLIARLPRPPLRWALRAAHVILRRPGGRIARYDLALATTPG